MTSRLLSTLGAVCLALAWTTASRPAAQAAPPTIDGAWTLNREASDRPGPDGAESEPDGRGGRGGRGGPAGPGGRGGRGGFGGGFGRGRAGGPGGRGGMDREALERRIEAMRAIVRPAERLTITRTPSMVIITNEEGSTTRLAPDGSRVKDESTGIERRSRWDGATLVTEITGVQGGRITETYAADPTTGQLIVTLQLPPRRNSDDKTGQTLRRVYEPQR